MEKNNINISNFVLIESQVLLDKNLNNTEKILYSYISALTNNKNNECFATTKHLSKIIGLKPRQLCYSLSKLKKYDYIDIKIENNNRRIITTKLNKFLEARSISNENIDLFDYDWLDNEEE